MTIATASGFFVLTFCVSCFGASRRRCFATGPLLQRGTRKIASFRDPKNRGERPCFHGADGPPSRPGQANAGSVSRIPAVICPAIIARRSFRWFLAEPKSVVAGGRNHPNRAH